MARKRISEFRAKILLNNALGQDYTGIQVNEDKSLINNLDPKKNFIVKVDQGVKGRFKKGLVKFNLSNKQIPHVIKELQEKGYTQFLVEEMQNYNSADEKYISIERTREGYKLLYSEEGGINIEENSETITEIIIANITDVPSLHSISHKILELLLFAFEKYYFSFLEINPFIINDSTFVILDAAVEIDSTAEFFVNNAWTEQDTIAKRLRFEEEENVKKLASKSQAAFSLEVLNSHGNIFMLLSGGGASIVLADETANLGFGRQLANYGEYSGNPSAEETYIYTKNILSLLLKSIAPKKVLIIAGGVANFTDVRITFNGLIKALNECKEDLKKQNIKVFVRRGGPFQEEGLNNIKQFLEKENLLGIVAGPEMVLTDIVSNAIATIS